MSSMPQSPTAASTSRGFAPPIAGAAFVVPPLFDDPEVLALPAAPRLPGRDSASLADLASEPMLRYDTAPRHGAGHRLRNAGSGPWRKSSRLSRWATASP